MSNVSQNPHQETTAPASDTGARFLSPQPQASASLEARSYDHWHVDLHERWEIEFWTKHLACDEQALRDAVFDVGSRVGAVRAYLAAHGSSRL